MSAEPCSTVRHVALGGSKGCAAEDAQSALSALAFLSTQVPAHWRDQLERIHCYTARGAVALEHLEEDATGDLVYTFTKPWSDGTTGVDIFLESLWLGGDTHYDGSRLHEDRQGGIATLQEVPFARRQSPFADYRASIAADLWQRPPQ